MAAGSYRNFPVAPSVRDRQFTVDTVGYPFGDLKNKLTKQISSDLGNVIDIYLRKMVGESMCRKIIAPYSTTLAYGGSDPKT